MLEIDHGGKRKPRLGRCAHAGKAKATVQINAQPISNLNRMFILLKEVSRSATDARGRREFVGVDILIAKPDPVLIEPSQRLLKEPRLWITRRHGSLHDIELVLVHVDRCEGAGFIGVW